MSDKKGHGNNMTMDLKPEAQLSNYITIAGPPLQVARKWGPVGAGPGRIGLRLK
jgi:hypothetical protein